MNYTDKTPLTQVALPISTETNGDIIIPADIVEQGILFIPSGMPSFLQHGEAKLIHKEFNYGTKDKPRQRDIYIHKYHGELIDPDKGSPCYCPECSRQLADNGTVTCTLAHLPQGDNYTQIEVDRRRVRCTNSNCKYNYTYFVDFKADGHMITQSLLNYTENLLSYNTFTLKEIAHITGLNKNTVKDIHKVMLQEKYTVDGKGKELIKPEEYAKYIAIDEFKLHDGNKYATIIINLENGHILHLAHGRKKEAVYEFIDRVGDEWMSHVVAAASDMNSDFEEAIKDRCPHIDWCWDRFHLIKNFNEKVISAVRKDEQKRLIAEGHPEAAAALKGSKYILIENSETRTQKDQDAADGKTVSKASELFNKPELKQKGGHNERYEKLISENKLLSTIDIIKEALIDAYKETSVRRMGMKIKDIIEICKATENEHFLWFARLLESHFEGIVNHAKYHISTGKLEGINCMIKTERRKGYGYPDDEYFFLRLMDASRRKQVY